VTAPLSRRGNSREIPPRQKGGPRRPKLGAVWPRPKSQRSRHGGRSSLSTYKPQTGSAENKSRCVNAPKQPRPKIIQQAQAAIRPWLHPRGEGLKHDAQARPTYVEYLEVTQRLLRPGTLIMSVRVTCCASTRSSNGLLCYGSRSHSRLAGKLRCPRSHALSYIPALSSVKVSRASWRRAHLSPCALPQALRTCPAQ
jgi:hypothetical protein